ncbi:MAG TPA: DUF359 domain-containing protein [Methanomicrobia archaeon]|nr:DUF359 domain-containing protein [Methanomicrobia archaeon]
MKLTPTVEAILKRPLGVLIRGDPPQPYGILSMSFGHELPIVAVGDVVTKSLEDEGITPILSIFDGHTKRRSMNTAEELRAKADMVVSNPRSAITRELWDAIKHCDFNYRKLFIDGEEDLATLPAILFAPEGSLVVYGQPDEGIVVVHITDEKRDEVRSILAMMEGETWN